MCFCTKLTAGDWTQLIFAVVPQGGELESPDRHGANPLVDPPLAAADAGAAGAAVLAHPQQAGQRPAEVAPQRLLCQAHPSALEGCVHSWLVGGFHGQEHRA